jgi:hypothetical protein
MSEYLKGETSKINSLPSQQQKVLKYKELILNLFQLKNISDLKDLVILSTNTLYNTINSTWWTSSNKCQ